MYWKKGLVVGLMAMIGVACGEPPVDEQATDANMPPLGPILDNVYSVVVAEAVDGCNFNPVRVGRHGEVDVMLRPDGLVNLLSWRAPFPGYQPVLKRVTVKPDGHVDHQSSYRSSSGRDCQYRISGSLLPESMDLVLEHTDAQDCLFRVRLRGKPRPLADATALDGLYDLRMSALGIACPGQEPDGKVLGEWSALANVRQYGNRIQVLLDKVLLFEMDAAAARGQVRHEGQAKNVSQSPVEYTWVTWDGQLRLERSDGRLTIGFIDQASDTCPHVYRFSGRKLLPSADDVTGLYRARYQVKTDCPFHEEVVPEDFDDQVVALIQPNGRLRVRDKVRHFDLEKQSDGCWQYQEDYQEEDFGQTMTVTFRPDLPEMEYRIHIVYRYVSGGQQATCQSEVLAKGTKRFVRVE